MKKGLIINYNDVAALLANESDDEQSEFFKVFIKELKACCKTNYNAELQLAGVNLKLTEEERELIGMLGDIGKETPNE